MIFTNPPEIYPLLLSEAYDQINALTKALGPEQRVFAQSFSRLKAEIEALNENPDWDDIYASELDRELLDAYAAILRCMNLLATYSQFPSSFDLLLDPQRADAIQAAELDEKVNGIYAFADGEMLRFRTPPLPRRREMNAERASRSRYGRATPASVYAQGLCRVIDENRSILSPVAKMMTRKNIYFLNLFAPQNHNAPDNDNRDIEKIINALCRIFPGRDTPETTRIILDGTASDELPEGTYITVNSHEKGLPSEKETIAFWRGKFCL